MKQPKAARKTGALPTVLDGLEPDLEPDDVDQTKAPVRACYRYLKNRKPQLDYPTARERDWPIGSGEIESAHRYIVQQRLKLSGAWWTPDNAKAMLALRVTRANGLWSVSWQNLEKSA